MSYHYARVLLLVVGLLMLGVAVLPVFAMLRVPDNWHTGLVAMKLLMLPIGAMCLLGAAGLRSRYGRR